MDPRLDWSTPEQLGPAQKHWLRLWEASTLTQVGESENIMINDTNQNKKNLERQQDFIPLELRSLDVQHHNLENRRQNLIKGDGGNKASTYGLSHSRNLNILVENKLVPWMKPDKPYDQYNSIMCLHEEIKDFYAYMSPTEPEQLMRRRVVSRIRSVIQGLWPQADVQVFGSFETGLYLPTSDIDLVVFGKWPNLPLWTLEQELVKQGIAESGTTKVLDKASVPIIKMVDKDTDVKVDISFNQVSGIQSVKLIKEFLDEYPVLRYLVLILKQFLLQRDLNEVYTGGISSYCLLYLIISFLQLHSVYDARNPHPPNLAILLIEFLELYGRHFNYHKVGIRIKDGGSYIQKGKLTNLQNGTAPSFLYIEDPVNTDNDIGRSSYGAFQVKQSFDHAFMVLTSHPFQRRRGESVLGRIIRVTNDVAQYRQWIVENFQPPTPDYELRIDAADSAMSDRSSTCSSSSECGTKSSYAKVVSQHNSKRNLRSGSGCRLPGGSEGESECPTDASSISPSSSRSGSSSRSSSLASDSDSESVSSKSSKSVPTSPTKSRTVAARNSQSATAVVSATKVSSTNQRSSKQCLQKQNSSSEQSQRHMKSTSTSTSDCHSSPSNTTNLTATNCGNNSYGKQSHSKHSYPRIVVNSNSKQHQLNTNNNHNNPNSWPAISVPPTGSKAATHRSGGKRRKTVSGSSQRDTRSSSQSSR